MKQKATAAPMMARVYLRVSTDAQDLERQEGIIAAAKSPASTARRPAEHAPTGPS